MRYARLLMLFAIIVTSPANAFADSGWWVWLEELSGPGPFGGLMASHPLHCWTDGGNSTKCDGSVSLNSTEPVRRSVRLTYGFLSSYNYARLKNGSVPADAASSNKMPVYAIPLIATYTVRTHRLWEFGTGGGGLFFSGHDVNSNARIILTPVTVSWRFLGTPHNLKVDQMSKRLRWALEGQTYLIFRGFNGTSFSAVDTGYKTPPVELHGVIGLSYTFAERR